MNQIALSILIGFLIDCCLGDPHRLPHPVIFIGKLISLLEKFFRRVLPKTRQGEWVAGGLIWIFTTAISFLVPWGILRLCGQVSPWLALAVQSIMCWQIIAPRSLRDESMAVCRKLEAGDTEGARYAVSMIVGRDTKPLSEAGIARAAVETVAENASDGVIAPLFYLAIGGPLLGWLYKAVNTMDSMVGYKNDRYLHFGRAAAKLDDLVNLIPSRLAALLLIVSAYLLRYDGKNAYRIWRRDRRNHKSPNSAQTESACAGALGLRLAGDAWYFGKLVPKPYIGDEIHPIEPQDIRRVNRLMYGAAGIMGLLALVMRAVILF